MEPGYSYIINNGSDTKKLRRILLTSKLTSKHVKQTSHNNKTRELIEHDSCLTSIMLHEYGKVHSMGTMGI